MLIKLCPTGRKVLRPGHEAIEKERRLKHPSLTVHDLLAFHRYSGLAFRFCESCTR